MVGIPINTSEKKLTTLIENTFGKMEIVEFVRIKPVLSISLLGSEHKVPLAPIIHDIGFCLEVWKKVILY